MKLHLSNVLLAAGALSLTAFGAIGCAATTPTDSEESQDVVASEEADVSEDVGESQDAVGTCITIKRGVTGNVYDAFTSGDAPGYKPGGEVNMFSGVSSNGNINRVLVNFDLSAVPAHATIHSANFNIYKSWSADNATVNVYRATKAWDEANVSASTGVTFDPNAVGSFSGGGVGFKTVDIKNVVQGWKAGTPQYGIVIDEAPTNAHHYFSSESNTVGPWLDVCYTTASCNDGLQNQGEQGVDCGGPCNPCVSCNDGVQNQGEQGIDCGGPCPQCPSVQITGPGEAYGHHGACSGWNSCGSAATCALWACYAKGYSTLVSHGASGPCTGFGVCHLFNSPCAGPNQCSIRYNWGNWCGVFGVTDIKCN